MADRLARHKLVGERLAFIGATTVALILALWLTSGAWGARPPSGEDTMAHLVRAEFAVRNLFAHGRPDGWQPNFILGYQEFLFIGPAFTWAVAALHWISLGLLSVPGAFKVVVVGSVVAVPLTVAFLGRSFGLSQRAAGLAAILSLAVDSPFGGVGLQGLFGVGLLIHQFGAIFFFLALGASVRLLADRERRWVVFTAASLAGLIMSHGISVIIFPVLLAVFLLLTLMPFPPKSGRLSLGRRHVHQRDMPRGLTGGDPMVEVEPATAVAESGRAVPDLRAVGRLLSAFVLAGGLAGVVLLPFWGHRDLRGSFSSWATPPLGQRLAAITRGDILFRPDVAFLILAGFGYGLLRVMRRRPYAVPVVATPLLYLALSHAAFHQWPRSVITTQLTNRALGYVGVLAILPLAALVAAITAKLRWVRDLAGIGVALAIVLLPEGSAGQQLARQTVEPVPQVREAARQLARLVPTGARFATERDFPEEIWRTGGLVNPDRWLAWASGRNTLNNFNLESSQTPGPALEPEHIRDRPPEAVADALSGLGVTHLVTVSDETADEIGRSSRFATVWRASPIAIFRVTARLGQPDPSALLATAAPAYARLVRWAPEHLQIDVEATRATTGTLALGWSPKWHARVDGRSVPMAKNAEGLLTLQLPPGRRLLQLDFRADAWDRLGLLCTLATAAGTLWFLHRRYGRNNRDRTASPRWRRNRTMVHRVARP